MFDFLKGKKAYIAGAAMIVHGIFVTGWYVGDWVSAQTAILTGLTLMGLRAGISKA